MLNNITRLPEWLSVQPFDKDPLESQVMISGWPAYYEDKKQFIGSDWILNIRGVLELPYTNIYSDT